MMVDNQSTTQKIGILLFVLCARSIGFGVSYRGDGGLCEYFNCSCKLLNGVPKCVPNEDINEPYCDYSAKPRWYNTICASNGRTFMNQWVLAEVSCETNTPLTIVHAGECNGTIPSHTPSPSKPESTTAIKPKPKPRPGNYTAEGLCGIACCQLCRLHDGVPKCFDGKDEEYCPDIEVDLPNPVCASDGRTYSNKFIVPKISCETNTPLKILHNGKCNSTKPRLGNWAPFAPSVF
uniref:Kazal-like domain-containing protein n=1 Tax=Aceria tosichella TaxID=561515 RepID=A0A6G1SG21_9ACAR